MMRYFDLIVVIFVLGVLCFDFIILGTFNLFSLIMISIAGLDFIMSSYGFVFLFIKSERKLTTTPYIETKNNFPSDYDRLNPITQREAYASWLKELGVIKEKKKRLVETNYLANIYDLVSSKSIFGKHE